MERMSGYGPYFADDEESSEDKISHLGSVNTVENDQTKTSGAFTKDGTSENQDDPKSNGASAFPSSNQTNEDNTSFVSTTFSDPNDHGSRKQASAGKPKIPRAQSDSRFCPESPEVSCDDLVIVLEESKFLKVLEDVVKELVEKLVTEKISNRGSTGSRNQISGNEGSRSKPTGKTVDIKKGFDKRVKDLAELRKNDSEKPVASPDLSRHVQHEQINLDDGNLTPHPSQPKSSKTPSESTQGKTAQPKTKVTKSNASRSKVNSATSRTGAVESSSIHDYKPWPSQVCYFKSKSTTAKKTPKKERGSHYRDNTCKTICRTYVRTSPEDLKEQNVKIANSLFAATFSLFMNKIKKQDTLAEKLGIALCGPRQCFEECSSQEWTNGQLDYPEAQSDAQNRAQLRSGTKSGVVLPRLNSRRGTKKSSGHNGQQAWACVKHCVDATTHARSAPTVLPKL